MRVPECYYSPYRVSYRNRIKEENIRNNNVINGNKFYNKKNNGKGKKR